MTEFVDRGVSGAKDRRPALDEPVAAARKREIDAVLIVKLDRLARSMKHLVTVAAELEALEVTWLRGIFYADAAPRIEAARPLPNTEQ